MVVVVVSRAPNESGISLAEKHVLLGALVHLFHALGRLDGIPGCLSAPRLYIWLEGYTICSARDLHERCQT